MPLVTAGSGVALGLPQNFRSAGLLADTAVAAALPAAGGCARSSRVVARSRRKGRWRRCGSSIRRSTSIPSISPAAAMSWRSAGVGEEPRRREPVLVYATDTPECGQGGAGPAGAEKAGSLVEEALAAIARGLVAMGVGR